MVTLFLKWNLPELGTGIVFEDDIIGGVIPKEFINSIEKRRYGICRGGLFWPATQ